MDMSNPVVVSVDREQRERDVANTLGSLRIEGFELDAEARAILDQYITGEITLDDVGIVFTRYP